MELAAILERSIAVERRAGGLYRRFAAAPDARGGLRTVWLRLAAEEDEHAAALTLALATLDPAVGARSRVEGWDDALARAEEVLADGERVLAPSLDDQLALALDLERTEIDALRELLLALSDQAVETGTATSRHALELADVAARHSTDPRVRIREAMVRAHQRLT